jgi:hypothetical protein
MDATLGHGTYGRPGGRQPTGRRVESAPTADGGREWVRTVACAHCASDDVTGLVPDLADGSVSMSYRCEACGRWTVLTAHTHDGGRAYVTRSPGSHA